MKWYKKSAEQGNADAQYSLGWCYYYGKGIAKNLQEAVNWYKKSAGQDNSDAQFQLGNCYAWGKGVGKDLREAFTWYMKAAEQNDERAQRNVGICYYSGYGVAKNSERASLGSLRRQSKEMPILKTIWDKHISMAMVLRRTTRWL